MKVYVDRWHCPGCDLQLEYRSGPDFPSVDESIGPRCSECGYKLRRDTSSTWLPTVIVTFER